MTLYRKYRPQKIAELDNTQIRERLSRVFSSSFLPHALLFTGPKGTGKTSAARIVAKILNCEQKKKSSQNSVVSSQLKGKKDKVLTTDDRQLTTNIEPCNSCESCKAITDGRYLDVLEIDAASNRGIEEIRDLREKIKLLPVAGMYKVYIIDEVHMLTNEAFNALLKTLEEPPKHAVFILATTESEKLPETITSRCIRFNFSRATDGEIVNCLKRVILGEKIQVNESVVALIAQASDGSFRDATKILEQAILEDALEIDKLKMLLGRQHIHVGQLLKILSTKKTKEILNEIVKMGNDGVNFRFLVEEVLHLLHDLLLAKYDIGQDKVEVSLLDAYTVNDINELIKLFSRVYTEIKNASIPQLPLEVAVVEWCESDIKNKK